MPNDPCMDKLWAMDFDELETHDGSRTDCISAIQNNKQCMISSCLKFKCTNNAPKYETLMLSLQRTINLNAVTWKLILYPTDNFDAFKDIKIDEGKHEQPLKTTSKCKEGNFTPEVGFSLNKLYGLQNYCQRMRNSGTQRTTYE